MSTPPPPSPPPPWVDDGNAALLTDLYELAMAQAYLREGMDGEAVFSLYYRTLPRGRNYLVACGLDDALRFLETFRFGADALEFLAARPELSREFVDWLGELRFEGDVWALPEGTPVFPEEPLVEVRAPIAAAQLAESFLMNQVHFQTVLASKAARIVAAARGRAVVDFALRRMHGTDAAIKGVRAGWIAGLTATSNVLAGRVYGVPLAGTMAHSYVQAHDDEAEAFRAFARLYPETVLLVDTYDTLEGVRKVVELARELGEAFRVRAVRLDSGDLGELAVETRKILDRAGLERVEIFASGGLDEHRIAALVAGGAPIDGFGVGTDLGVSADAPALDMAYKLTDYAGRGRLKLSPGKRILPGRKQVYRFEEGAGENRTAIRDVIARADEGEEAFPGARALLVQVMAAGERLPAGRVSLDQARERSRKEIARLPERLRALEDAGEPYPVEISPELARLQAEVAERIEGRIEEGERA